MVSNASDFGEEEEVILLQCYVHISVAQSVAPVSQYKEITDITDSMDLEYLHTLSQS